MTLLAPKQTGGSKTEQMEFPSLMFPADRKVLRVGEIAPILRVSENHIIDLLEEGKMLGVDVAGRHEFIRVPTSALAELSRLTKLPEQAILDVIRKHKPAFQVGRAHWRIPIEGWKHFLAENHSLSK